MTNGLHDHDAPDSVRRRVEAHTPAGFVVHPDRRLAARAGLLADVAAGWLRSRLPAETLSRLDLSDLAAQQMSALVAQED